MKRVDIFTLVPRRVQLVRPAASRLDCCGIRLD
jgi:hypothetical protein